MSLRLWHVIAALSASIATATSASAQSVLPKPDVAAELVKQVSQPTQEEYYAKLRDARRRNTPRVVFVPGILGSKIEECRADGSGCDPIWGTWGALRKTDINLAIRSDRKYKTDVAKSLFFKEIYGGTIDHIHKRAQELISDSPEDPLLTVFHYDWRQSNWDNAVGLAKTICAIRSAAPHSPITIVAHSMGGIMTKVWLNKHSGTPCANSLEPRVKRILFVATPHLGSPKTIQAIVEGYSLLFDETKIWFKPLYYLETNYVLNALNQAGPSYPSIYELLPIRSSEFCTATKPALSAAAVPASATDGKPINVFDPETWRKHDLLNRIGGSADSRGVYYDQRIAPLLKKAEERLCELADYDPSKATEVTYVIGRVKTDNTLGRASLNLGTREILKNPMNVEGDGTVPFYSAKNSLVNLNGPNIETDADHISIINHWKLIREIDTWYKDAEAKAKKEIAALGSANFDMMMLAETAASGDLLPVSLDANLWSESDNQLAIQINKRALAGMAYSVSDIAKFAAADIADPLNRANLYAISASLTDVPSQKVEWLTDVAHWAFVSSKYDVAIANSELVLGTKSESRNTVTNFAELEKHANKLIGWSYLQRGDTAKYDYVASEYKQKYSAELGAPTTWGTAYMLSERPARFSSGRPWAPYVTDGYPDKWEDYFSGKYTYGHK